MVRVDPRHGRHHVGDLLHVGEGRARQRVQPDTVVEDTKFELIGEASLDGRNRVALTKAVEVLQKLFGAVEGLRFKIHYNKAGQILLIPETTIPLREAWLYRNPEALKSVLIGIEQAGRGELHDLGSFAQYADDDIE